jgi:glycosyl transferase family 25
MGSSLEDGSPSVNKIVTIRLSVKSVFPLKVCINLYRRPERWQRMQHAIAAHSLEPVQRFSAIDGNEVALPPGWTHTAGAYGCLLSHVDVVREARQARVSSVLIFEDDVVFDPRFKEKVAAFIQELPADWDMLFLGALHKDEPVRVSDHIGRITKANSTFAYAVRNTVFDAFIELNSRAEHVLDMNNYLLQERFNCYCFMPNLAWVESEYSDVQNRLENHWYLEKSLVLFGNHMDRLLSQSQIIIARESANLDFLVDYYREYFDPLVSIAIGNTNLKKEFLVLIDDDIYFEAMDIRANLLMCEQYGAATGFLKLIDLTPEQTAHLRRTGLTRGINVSRNPFSNIETDRCLFRTRNARRIFRSPNHALRLAGGSTNRK